MPCVTPPLRTWRRKGNALLRIASDSACRVDPVDKPKCNWINCVRGGRRYSLQAQGDFCGTALKPIMSNAIRLSLHHRSVPQLRPGASCARCEENLRPGARHVLPRRLARRGTACLSAGSRATYWRPATPQVTTWRGCYHLVRWMPAPHKGSYYVFDERSNLLFKNSLFLIHNFVQWRGVVLSPLVARDTRRGRFPSTPA
jgi:hypothetical protein